jgi:hypothetical protein
MGKAARLGGQRQLASRARLRGALQGQQRLQPFFHMRREPCAHSRLDRCAQRALEQFIGNQADLWCERRGAGGKMTDDRAIPP